MVPSLWKTWQNFLKKLNMFVIFSSAKNVERLDMSWRHGFSVDCCFWFYDRTFPPLFWQPSHQTPKVQQPHGWNWVLEHQTSTVSSYNDTQAKDLDISPGWCDSVDWTHTYEPKVAGWIPCQGACLVCRARSPVAGAWETTTHWCLPPSLSPTLTFSLKIKK